MAIYHLSVKTIGRSAGRTATAAAAYRAAAEITDERTGEVHDYSRKRDVESATLIVPEDAPEWASDRAALWNAAEQSETRKNSTVAREFEIALPSELSADERRAMAHDFARAIVERHGCAADVAIHAPGREGDNRNHHAHILCTTRRLTPDGFGEKCRELDDRKTREVEGWRERFADLQNAHLERAGVAERVDHRSLKEQGIEREPTQHLGPAAVGYERRTGEPSDNRTRHAQQAAERLAQVELDQLENRNDDAAEAIEDIKAELENALVQRIRAAREARLKAERDQAERDQAEKTQAEKERAERIERMSAAEVRAEISKIRPPQLHDVVERQPEMVEALKHSQGLIKEALQKRSEAAQALRENMDWREAHPLRAKAHDAGLLRSRVLLETEQRREDAQAGWNRLEPLADAAVAQAEHVRSNTGRRVAYEQAPALAKVAELEQLEREKQVKERDERARVREAEKLLEEVRIHAHKREMRAEGYEDTGRHWKAIAKPIQKLIDGTNEMPKRDREFVLNAFGKSAARNWGNIEKFANSFAESKSQDSEQSKKQDRGMSR